MRGLLILILISVALPAYAQLGGDAQDGVRALAEGAAEGAAEVAAQGQPGAGQPGQPSKREVDAKARDTIRQNQAGADALVDQRVQEILASRAKALAWVRGRADDQWLGLPRLYLGNGWSLKSPCSEDGRCAPREVLLYGIEGVFHPVGFLDLWGRFGGATYTFDGSPTRHGMDASAGVALNLLGLLALTGGWFMQTEQFTFAELVDGVAVSRSETATRHGGEIGVSVSIRGASVQGWVRIAGREAVEPTGQRWEATTAMGGLRLMTPTLWGF